MRITWICKLFKCFVYSSPLSSPIPKHVLQAAKGAGKEDG